MTRVQDPADLISKHHDTPKPSIWKTTEPVALTRESFLDLLQGETPLIRVPELLQHDQCRRLADHILPTFTPYIHATGPAVEKVGVAQFEFQAQSAEDFENRQGDGKSRLPTSLETTN